MTDESKLTENLACETTAVSDHPAPTEDSPAKQAEDKLLIRKYPVSLN